MAMDRSKIITISIVAIIVILLAILIYAMTAKTTTTTINQGGGVKQGGLSGLWSSISSIWGGMASTGTSTSAGAPLGTGCPSVSGLDVNGTPCPSDCYNGCRSSQPGMDCNGNLSSNC